MHAVLEATEDAFVLHGHCRGKRTTYDEEVCVTRGVKGKAVQPGAVDRLPSVSIGRDVIGHPQCLQLTFRLSQDLHVADGREMSDQKRALVRFDLSLMVLGHVTRTPGIICSCRVATHSNSHQCGFRGGYCRTKRRMARR